VGDEGGGGRNLLSSKAQFFCDLFDEFGLHGWSKRGSALRSGKSKCRH
ncbi:MAG: hypothetical protein ACI8ZW_002145, partial [Yoonia sp.]